MSKKYFKKALIILTLFIIISASFYFIKSVNAEGGAQASIKTQLEAAGQPWGGGTPTGNSSLGGIMAVAIKAFLGLLGIIFLVLIIYAGFTWMTAQGEEEKVTRAKETLQRAIIGLIIIVAAYSITYFVFNSLPGGGSGSGGSTPSPSPVINTGG
ncbi:MAG: hypothetical protein WC349_02600 [Patescibacteria group bacterium]|jgi:nicotinamide riboside transporter PnuC